MLDLENEWEEKIKIRMDKGQYLIFRYLRGWIIYLQNDEDLEKLYNYIKNCIEYGEKESNVK